MSDKPCPLCGREMTAIESYAGRGELYCGHCDLTIGGNEAKTPDELMALLGQRTCVDTDDDPNDFKCSSCGARSYIQANDTYTTVLDDHVTILKKFNYCPNCGKQIVSD